MNVYVSQQWQAGVRNVPASIVLANFSLTNDRKEFDPDELRSLADSIQQHGLLQRPTVRPMPKMWQGRCVFCGSSSCDCPDEVLELVAGDRRTKAMTTVLKWDSLPVEIKPMSDEAVADAMLLENVQRADLNPIEEATAYRQRIDLFGRSVAEIAEKANVSVQRVKERLALLTLPANVQQLIKTRQMSLAHANVLITAGDVLDSVLRVYMRRPSMATQELMTLIVKLQTANAQGGLFDAVAWAETAVLNKVPMTGPGVKLDLPKDETLPPLPEFTSADGVGGAMRKWLDALMAQDRTSEAAAIGVVYQALVEKRMIFRGEDLWQRAGL